MEFQLLAVSHTIYILLKFVETPKLEWPMNRPQAVSRPIIIDLNVYIIFAVYFYGVLLCLMLPPFCSALCGTCLCDALDWPFASANWNIRKTLLLWQ